MNLVLHKFKYKITNEGETLISPWLTDNSPSKSAINKTLKIAEEK